VRVCAQFPGWANHCRDGHLSVRISNKGRYIPVCARWKTVAEPSCSGPRPPLRGTPVDWADISERNSKLQGQLEGFLNNSTPDGVKPALSVETQLLCQPFRADESYGVSERPLRLLSLGMFASVRSRYL
jgi:hypothetical protein